jgi:hypothetical protein
MQIPFAGFFSQKFAKAVFDFTHSSKKIPEWYVLRVTVLKIAAL